jgi:cell shape-determining protein MreC
MNYRRHSKKESKGIRFIYIAGVFAIFLFLFPFLASLAGIPKNTIINNATPLWVFRNSMGVFTEGTFSLFSSKKTLIEENKKLRSDLATHAALSIEYDILKNENEELRGLLGRIEGQEDLVIASILVRPRKSPYDTLIIDIGKDNNISTGSRVVLSEDILLGEISEVFDHSSKVVLYSNPGVITQVSIGEGNITAEAKGIGGGNYEIELPRDVPIEEGASVRVLGIKGGILGIIERVESTPQDPSKKILFKIPVNIQEIEWVTVIRGG